MSWRKQNSKEAANVGGMAGVAPKRGESSIRGASQAQSGGSRWAAAAAVSSSSSAGGYRSYASEADLERENYESSDWLQERTSQIQDESVQASRRALAKLKQTEVVGQGNLSKMASQSEQLTRIESKLDTANTKVKLSDAKADQLKALNRFFFIPTFGAGKKVKKREEQVKRELMQAELEQEERMKRDEERLAQFRNTGRPDRSHAERQSSRTMSTPYGIARDEREEEIDGNLDEISSGLNRLKMMGQAMNQELATQDAQLTRLYDKTAATDERVKNTTGKINRLLKK